MVTNQNNKNIKFEKKIYKKKNYLAKNTPETMKKGKKHVKETKKRN